MSAASTSNGSSSNFVQGFQWKDLQFERTDRLSPSALVASVAGFMCLLLLLSMTAIFSYKIVTKKSKSQDGSGGILCNDNNKAEHLVSESLD